MPPPGRVVPIRILGYGFPEVATTHNGLDEDFRYGQLAIEGRLISPDQFDAAMDRVKATRRPLAEILAEDGAIDRQTADRLTKALRRIVRDERAKSEGGLHMKKQIGGYKLLRRIGEGGMGEVYLAEQLSMHRTVALKILHQKWADDEEFRKRFLLEARAVGKLSHQNLIQVFDVGKYQGLYYFSMEYIDGVTVEDLIKHDGPMAVEKAIDIAIQVGEALTYLAAHDIVHRDIKPANIMVTKDGQVKLGDFGFIQSAYDSQLLQEGTTIGTPDYISPEQARGERNLDVRSDIYSLGASLHHMLAGKTMYSGSCSQVMRAHLEVRPPALGELRAELPVRLVRIVEKAVAKEQIDRHQSPGELVRELEMLKIDVGTGSGALPATRSGILNVINAEKERLARTEKLVRTLQAQRLALAVACAAGWTAAILLLILHLAGV
jgi:serine/threonine protein kinase